MLEPTNSLSDIYRKRPRAATVTLDITKEVRLFLTITVLILVTSLLFLGAPSLASAHHAESHQRGHAESAPPHVHTPAEPEAPHTPEDPAPPVEENDEDTFAEEPIMDTTSLSTIPLQTKAPSSPTIMAWIYPGAPACKASTEYSDGRKVDVLKPEYFTVNEEAKLELLTVTDSGCNAYSLKNVEDIKQYSKEQFVTVSAGDPLRMRTFIESALQNKTGAVETLTAFVVEYSLTGIEIDFEGFGSWDTTTYTKYKAFITKLGNSLHSEGKKLMINGPAVSSLQEEQKWYVWRYADFVSLPVDTIVVMAYDYQYDYGSGAPVAPLPWIEKVIDFTLLRFPDASRLSIGIPTYGYQGVATSYDLKILTYEQLKSKAGFSTAKRDPLSGEMTWKNGKYVYFYQDSESMRQKLKTITDKGISSVSVWHLGGNLWF